MRLTVVPRARRLPVTGSRIREIDLSGASQQKRKEGEKRKRQARSSSSHEHHGQSAGSAAGARTPGERAGRGQWHAKGGASGDGSPPGKGTSDAQDAQHAQGAPDVADGSAGSDGE